MLLAKTEIVMTIILYKDSVDYRYRVNRYTRIGEIVFLYFELKIFLWWLLFYSLHFIIANKYICTAYVIDFVYTMVNVSCINMQ